MRRLAAEWELVILLLLVVILFLLQVQYLSQAAFPISDEGVHALVGRLLWEGQIPYRDFSYSHPLLLPHLLGLSQQFTPSMLPPRLVYLFLNMSSAIPLFLFLRRLNGNGFAALIATLFYVTYFQMVEHNFRFIAFRQATNVFLIWFLFVSTLPRQDGRTLLIQTLLAIAGALTMYQSAANLALCALAVTATHSGKERKELFLRYCAVGGCVVIALGVFLLVNPGSAQATLLDHGTRPVVDRLGRIAWTLNGDKTDLLLYAASIPSLLLGAIFLKQIRSFCVAALGIIGLVFGPNEFFPHYFDIAGPAFAIGIFAGMSLLMSLVKGNLIALFAGFVLLAAHWIIVLPSLVQEWMNNRHPEYYGLIQTLSQQPEPLLTFFEPIYAVESGRRTVLQFELSDFRTFGSLLGKQLEPRQYLSLSSRACTILLVPWDASYIPQDVQDHWFRTYQQIVAAPWAAVLRTNNEGCDR